MSEELEAYFKNHVAQHGPIDVGQFMNIALCHPEHGYYMKQDPFGVQGDFTTAPEVSQMFGEIIGAWVADVWIQMGRPSPFGLVELGPGRGTLMADIMRGCSKVDGFKEACVIHLIEISPALKSIQTETLKDQEVAWHQTIASVPQSYPLIILGNEFMDALPFRQLVKSESGWDERVVTEDLAFGLRPAGADLTQYIPERFASCDTGEVFEISPTRFSAMNNICDLLSQTTGVALLLDYGHDKAGLGDTFQALHKHDYVSVLEYMGDADLTSHVDFSALKKIAEHESAQVLPIVEQGAFLKALGIEQRAQYLMGQADEKQKADIESALHRLTSPDEMGSLFKVMGLVYGDSLKPAGF